MTPCTTVKQQNRLPDLTRFQLLAKNYCEHWVIENRPNAPLNDPVYLTGHMFNLGIEYERAFETSFDVEQPPKQSKLADTSPFFYSNRSKEWWAAAKGSDMSFNKEHLAKNTIPAAYIDYIMRHHALADDQKNREEMVDRDKYDEYDKQMQTRERGDLNAQLDRWQ